LGSNLRNLITLMALDTLRENVLAPSDDGTQAESS
jgi:hypothetical protein